MSKLCFVAFEILKSYPNINWEEAYVHLFEKAIKQGEKDLAIQVYYQIIAETIRTNNTSVLEELTNNKSKNYPALIDLNLYDFSIDLLRVIVRPTNRKRVPRKYMHDKFEFKHHSPKFQYRENAHILCVCCHEFVLTCDEIQNFPLEDDEIHIRETFKKALAQKELHKKRFLLEEFMMATCFSIAKATSFISAPSLYIRMHSFRIIQQGTTCSL